MASRAKVEGSLRRPNKEVIEILKSGGDGPIEKEKGEPGHSKGKIKGGAWIDGRIGKRRQRWSSPNQAASGHMQL
jgi:hypothetical protein